MIQSRLPDVDNFYEDFDLEAGTKGMVSFIFFLHIFQMLFTYFKFDTEIFDEWMEEDGNISLQIWNVTTGIFLSSAKNRVGDY